MKTKLSISGILSTALLAICLSGCASEKQEQAKLQSQARITKEQAQATALARVPDGTVKDAELEKEHGKLQWSFDLATPNSKETTEVNVDAITGGVISVQQESAASEAKESDRDND